ncbi:MAG: acyl-CoA synthetase FdrA, partial [Clostridiales bacterium]|nr:acyl-CoA synthetase FdrA [Clostridiales bacterium]
ILDEVLNKSDQFLNDLSVKKQSTGVKDVSSWDEALEQLPNANVALFSIPGEYGASEMEAALDRGLHVFSFTDNVSLEDEIKLKKKAHEKGLLMMGPDCGTGIISNIPIAFTNVVKSGNIGVVGASGTGIQEITTIIDRLGGGCVHAIGTGGRDLKNEVDAITMKDAIIALEHHDSTDVIVVVSKPPAKKVRDEVFNLLQSSKKPVVAIFLGEKPLSHEGNVYLAHTLEEAAQIAVDLSKGKMVKSNYFDKVEFETERPLDQSKQLIGLFSGGTLGAEANMLISEVIDQNDQFEIIDLGDDEYTQGKPHPMIDPEVRIQKIIHYARKNETGVILLDVVLGYGCHPDMAGVLSPIIREELRIADSENRELYFVATVVGTDKDPQSYDESVKTLKSVGVLVESSNAKAVQLALKLKGFEITEADKNQIPYESELTKIPQTSDSIRDLLETKPRIINVGIQSFNDSIREFGGESVHYKWKPKAGGNKKLIKILNELEKFDDEIRVWNQEVIELMKDSQPILIDVVPAKSVIPELNTDQKTLLHAGPPIAYEDMTGPMRGSVLGAMFFEGWAADEEQAKAMLEEGAVKFIPCHHVGAVGPMGGITSANMPVLIVENKLDNTRAYCTMNEGIGKVLRFGAYSSEVVNRLIWMRDVLGPTLSHAIKLTEHGINLNVIIAKAITMGDEFHQRNIAASLNFLKEVAPYIVELDIDEKDKRDVVKFLADTDQFFLNIMMAASKSIADCARKVTKGTVVTALTRNGKDFGIRISGMGDQWFTAPVNLPKGLYFTGYTEADGNPDIGDSAITETVGVGGMAMIAAPGVTRFVGAGGMADALEISNEMSKICISHNSNFSIPTWDFKGTCLGIDIRKVVETGITPIINTGIAHKNPGVGQVGAGTVRAPIACFEKAIEAYAESLGITIG